jgi:LacI family repressor for deo operon, udp, cdd, tsx, nupC, and nupG
VMLANSQADPEREVSVVRSFQERRVDGVLVASSRVGALYVPLLSELQIPIVLLNNQHPGEFVHSVTIDNVDGAYQATRHLTDLGHTDIAFVGDRFGVQSNTERLQGYRQAMNDAGLRVRREWTRAGDGKPGGGQKEAAVLLRQPDRPSAIVCYNDMTALGVLEAAKEQGLSVPGDLSVVGFDDLFFASLLHPSLTTIRQPKREMGRRSMELLLRMLRQEELAKTEIIRGELMVRESSGEPVSAELRVQPTSRSCPGKTPPRGPRNRA